MSRSHIGRRGLFVSVDGPGGVGKSTMIVELAAALARDNINAYLTTEPTRTPLGNCLRHGTDTYHGAALACLVAGDRHHHLATEVHPALDRGQVVISDRYVPSSLVLQRLDKLTWDQIWQLNADMTRPDLAVILGANPDVIAQRLTARGENHSRFERQPGAARAESTLYRDTSSRLRALGWPVCELDGTNLNPQQLAAIACAQILAIPENQERA